MDPFDEFEIKPLSEGLGFHKKAVPLNEQVKMAGLAEAAIGVVPNLAAKVEQEKEKLKSNIEIKPPQNPQAFSDLLKSLESPAPTRSNSQQTPRQAPNVITEPLPAPGTRKKKAMEIEIPRPPQPEFPSLNPRPQSSTPLNKVIENVGLRRGAADSPLPMLEKTAVSFAAGILDGIVVFALSLMFLVTLMTITKVDLAHLIFKVGLDSASKVAFGALFGSVLLMYIVVVRSFYGRSLGEWTFDLQMGDEQQHAKAKYPLQVLWRTLLILLSGVIVFPLLSAILRKDVLAPLTGIQLYRVK